MAVSGLSKITVYLNGTKSSKLPVVEHTVAHGYIAIFVTPVSFVAFIVSLKLCGRTILRRKSVTRGNTSTVVSRRGLLITC